VVVVKNKISMDKKCKNIIRKYDAGPIEFLNYIRNAKIIVSSSFHGNVFSIIFERPFLAIGGKQDARTGNLLSITGLLDRSVDNIENINALKKLFKVNFAEAKQAIAKEQKNTEAYFNDALDIERMKNE
ncbi:MAG: polysaccharide pyruvyl transferase family protein, partial [Lachnospiraceae bacterium]|nr:polysaccharide pyruvyl transferase family protein [Lachnospiraceae bacterium]